jgi:hypothetical protein
VRFSPVEEHIARVRALPGASLVGVASVSAYFLQMARVLFAPAIGRRHALREYLLTEKRKAQLGAADLMFCDSVAYGVVRMQYRAATVIRHDVISRHCFEAIGSVLRPVKGALP